MYRIVSLTGLCVFAALRATAQTPPTVLTLQEALARARESSPAIASARMRIDEVRGRLTGASLLLQSNPSVEFAAGPRSGAVSSTDFEAAIAQDIDLPPRRRARIDAAHHAITAEEQRAREVERNVLRDVARTFLLALEARERAGAAMSSRRLAGEALLIAERRFHAGDVAQLDVNLARTAVARADADARNDAATLTVELTQLILLIGMPGDASVTVSGALRDMFPLRAADVMSAAVDRADVRVLDAEIAEAEAELRLAKTLRWPDLGLRSSYRREGDERIVLAGVGISLPLFNRGQEAGAVAGARAARLRVERDTLLRTIDGEVRGALAAYDARRSAAEQYEQTVLPLVEENERLALESYDVGQIGLAELLVTRREALDARRAFIDQLIEARLAETELRARAGVWK
jgi:cobalt-zinc-cadmium efflux system outer membrane protein